MSNLEKRGSRGAKAVRSLTRAPGKSVPKRPAMAKRSAAHATHEDRDTRQQLINAGFELFARAGFDGTSVKELAAHAGVNVSLVSYHFGGKEGLYRSCLETFGSQRIGQAERILAAPPQSREEFRVRLSMMIEEIFKTHMEHPNVCTIIHREADSGSPITHDIFERTLLRGFHVVVDFIRAAQARKIVRKELDPYIVAKFFYGSVLHNARMDKLEERIFKKTIKDANYRKQVVEQFIELIMSGCCL